MPHPKPIEWRIVKPQVDKFLTTTAQELFGDHVRDHHDHPIVFTHGCSGCLDSMECKREVGEKGLVQAVVGLDNATLVKQAQLLANLLPPERGTELERLYE